MTNINQMIQDALETLSREPRNLSDEFMYESGHRPLCGRIMSVKGELAALRAKHLAMLPTKEELDQAINRLHQAADEEERIHSIPAFRYLKLK